MLSVQYFTHSLGTSVLLLFAQHTTVLLLLTEE